MKSISLLPHSQNLAILSHCEIDKSIPRSAKWRIPFMFSYQNLKFCIFPIFSLYVTCSVNGILICLITKDLSQDTS